MREARGLTQQQIAKLEDPDANPTIETVTKVAKAFDMNLLVSFQKPAIAERHRQDLDDRPA